MRILIIVEISLKMICLIQLILSHSLSWNVKKIIYKNQVKNLVLLEKLNFIIDFLLIIY